MHQRTLVPLVALVLASPLAATGPAGFGRGAREPYRVGELHAGGWVAWIDLTAAGFGQRAIPYRQEVYRQAPGRQPERLFEQTSAGAVWIRLRDDGLLCLQGVGGVPSLYFPGAREPVPIQLLPPERGAQPGGYPDIAANNGHVSFHDDVLSYGRYYTVDEYLIGFLRIDASGRRVAEQRLVADVYAAHDGGSGAWAASITTPPPLRIGDYLFWRNRGWDNVYYPDLVRGTWKEQRARVIDLRGGRLVEFHEVPRMLRETHAAELAPFLKE